jgi:hypothetical protein
LTQSKGPSLNGYGYPYNGILFSLKKEEIVTHVPTWMKLGDFMLSELSQSQEDKCCMIPLCEVPKAVEFRDRSKWRLPGAGRGLSV